LRGDHGIGPCLDHGRDSHGIAAGHAAAGIDQHGFAGRVEGGGEAGAVAAAFGQFEPARDLADLAEAQPHAAIGADIGRQERIGGGRNGRREHL
jgi:hypothetical protein